MEGKKQPSLKSQLGLLLVLAPMVLGIGVPLALNALVPGPEELTDRVAFARTLSRAGSKRDAFRVIRSALRERPDDPVVHEARIRLLAGSTGGCVRRAWEGYVAMSEDPEHHDLGWFARGWTLLRRDDPVAALAAWADVDDASFPGLSLGRAAAYDDLGHDAEVGRLLRLAVRADDAFSARARDALSDWHLEHGDWDAAQALYEDASDLRAPYDAAALLRAGRVLDSVGATARVFSTTAPAYAVFLLFVLFANAWWLQRRSGRSAGATWTVASACAVGALLQFVTTPVVAALGGAELAASGALAEGLVVVARAWAPIVVGCAVCFAVMLRRGRTAPDLLALAGASVGLGAACVGSWALWSTGIVVLGLGALLVYWPTAIALGGMLGLLVGEASLRDRSMPRWFALGALSLGAIPLGLGAAFHHEVSSGVYAAMLVPAVGTMLFSSMWGQAQLLRGPLVYMDGKEGLRLIGLLTAVCIAFGVAIAFALPAGHRSAQLHVPQLWLVGMWWMLLFPPKKLQEAWTPDWPRRWWQAFRENNRKKPPAEPPATF